MLQAAFHTGLPEAGLPRLSPGFLDSGSHFHANATLIRQSAAATSPGAARPAFAAEEPITGPIIMPADVAAESHPRARVRSSGRTVSATYA